MSIFQIMAECDCPRFGMCLAARRCLAAEPQPVVTRRSLWRRILSAIGLRR